MEFLKEFFGFNNTYLREPEGYMSWQHLTFVSILMVIMFALAISLGIVYRKRSYKQKNNVLIAAAIAIDLFEIALIAIMMWRGKDLTVWQRKLPLFLCSIQLITIPLSAFTKGRIKEASLDFVSIFGLLGAILGTYLAGNNYGAYPVLSVDNVISGITHCISGFTALYIMISGMLSMKKKNIWITITILFGFGIGAYVANIFTDANYMFLLRGDGTPYTIIENLYKSFMPQLAYDIAYPLTVMALFVLYIAAFYGIYFLIMKLLSKKANKENN